MTVGYSIFFVNRERDKGIFNHEAIFRKTDRVRHMTNPKPRILCNQATPEYYFEERCYITEWSNSPDDEQASIARARVEPGATTRWHRLEGVTERYVILAGEGRVEVGDLAPEPVGPADVVVIPPGVAQRITNVGDADLVFLAICTPRFRREVYEDLDSGNGPAGPS